MVETEDMRYLEEQVRLNYKDEPRLIMRLREEAEGRVFYRVFWENPDKPSTVITVVWGENRGKFIKWLREAQAPVKGGVEIGTGQLKVYEIKEEHNAQPMSSNLAVRHAYHNGTYEDLKGNEWKRGLDGWFLDQGDLVHLVHHDEFVKVIEEERPDKP